ncbi:rhodanese-like domain-containing protein [Sutcliffiella deserti]|uniref:rhodanese-like domain-containing protein n=1 Tax=Sutcliffiella deserti TaxID=2875501 RepID=UPI001CC0620B|nr:rhodanese-like domain-containing protein [Sutcliffiella deserti]
MELIQYVLIGAIIVFAILKIKPTAGVRQLTTTDLKQELSDNSKQFIDVRTPGEYKGRHIKQFRNLPLATLHTEAGKLSKEKEVVVICQSGMRSNAAVKKLKKLGFTKVANVKGGMNAW